MEPIPGFPHGVESHMDLNIIKSQVTHILESYYWSDLELLFLIPNLEYEFEASLQYISYKNSTFGML